MSIAEINKNLSEERLEELLKTVLFKEKDVLFCYLFGSRAYQNFNNQSDIDIAVFLDKKSTKDLFQKRLELIAVFSRALKKETDVVILNNLHSIFFKYVIMKEGKLIFEKSQEPRIEFELKTLKQYFDFMPILKMYRQRVLVNKK